jgi:hypothetical protein
MSEINLNDYSEFINIPYVIDMKKLKEMRELNKNKTQELHNSSKQEEKTIYTNNYEENFPQINFFDLFRSEEEIKKINELKQNLKNTFIENYGKTIIPSNDKDYLDKVKKTYDETKKSIIFEIPKEPFKMPEKI